MYWNVILLSSTLLVSTGTAQDPTVPTFEFAQSAKAGDKSGENALFEAGRSAIDAEDWDTAVVKFDKAAKLEGTHAAESLYWEAWAYMRLGNRNSALACLSDLRKKYPKSKWVDDARALEIELRGATYRITPAAPATPATSTRPATQTRPAMPATPATSTRPPMPAAPAMPATSATPATPDHDDDRPDRNDNDDLKLLALNQIIDNDPARAVPLIEKMLQGNSSLHLKEHALFVLAQSNDPKAYELVTRVANGETAPGLQRKAIQQLGVAGRKTELQKIYRQAPSSNVKVWVLDAYVICGNTAGFLEAAKNETDPAARKKAIQGLAINGAKQELRDLYKATSDKEAKRWILDAFVVDGDSQAYGEIARTETDPDLRKRAIHGLGVNGAKQELRDLYKSASDKETKLWVLDAFVIDGDSQAYGEIARTETDPDLRKRAINGLGVNGAKTELRALYRSSNDYDTKEAVLHAFVVAGDSEAFEDVALSEQNPDLRKKAINGIGVNGGRKAGPTLLALYDRFPDMDTRKQVLNALFIAGDSRDLIALFKKESDPKMKKEIVQKLSIMGGEEVREFMRSILDNE